MASTATNADGMLQSATPAAAGSMQATLGRILIASLFLVAGARKAMMYGVMTGVFGKMGIPMPEVVLPLVILLELGGGIALVLNWRTAQVAWALALFTVAAGVIGHPFWASDAAQYGNNLNHFLKNLAIAGGLLAVASMYTNRRS